MTSAASLVVSIASGAIGLAVGGALGMWLGRRYGAVKWRFWAINAGAFVLGSGLCALGLALGERWLALGALGLLGGLLTGTKYGTRGGFISVER